MANDEGRQNDTGMMNSEEDHDRDSRENMADDTTTTDDSVL